MRSVGLLGGRPLVVDVDGDRRERGLVPQVRRLLLERVEVGLAPGQLGLDQHDVAQVLRPVQQGRRSGRCCAAGPAAGPACRSPAWSRPWPSGPRTSGRPRPRGPPSPPRSPATAPAARGARSRPRRRRRCRSARRRPRRRTGPRSGARRSAPRRRRGPAAPRCPSRSPTVASRTGRGVGTASCPPPASLPRADVGGRGPPRAAPAGHRPVGGAARTRRRIPTSAIGEREPAEQGGDGRDGVRRVAGREGSWCWDGRYAAAVPEPSFVHAGAV